MEITCFGTRLGVSFTLVKLMKSGSRGHIWGISVPTRLCEASALLGRPAFARLGPIQAPAARWQAYEEHSGAQELEELALELYIQGSYVTETARNGHWLRRMGAQSAFKGAWRSFYAAKALLRRNDLAPQVYHQWPQACRGFRELG